MTQSRSITKNLATSDVIIRPFTLKDMNDCIDCGHRFHKESVYSDIPMNNYDLFKLGEKAESRDDHLFIVYEKDRNIVGMFMAHVVPYYFNHEAYVAQDILWYVDQKDRGTPKVAATTLKYYAAWAKTWSCKEAVIATSSGIQIERTNKLLTHLGFEQVGTVNKMRF